MLQSEFKIHTVPTHTALAGTSFLVHCPVQAVFIVVWCVILCGIASAHCVPALTFYSCIVVFKLLFVCKLDIPQ
jgi:hypothetical protein